MKKRALISVSDKTGVVEFAKGLEELGYEIISTGGTHKALENAGVKVISIDSLTGFPECLDGRSKNAASVCSRGYFGYAFQSGAYAYLGVLGDQYDRHCGGQPVSL